MLFAKEEAPNFPFSITFKKLLHSIDPGSFKFMSDAALLFLRELKRISKSGIIHTAEIAQAITFVRIALSFFFIRIIPAPHFLSSLES